MGEFDPYCSFARYNLWANRRAAEMLEGLTEAQRERPLQLLSHLLRAEQVWLGRVSGTDDANLTLWETDALEVCRRRIEANALWFEKVLEGLEPQALAQPIHYTNTKGTPYTTPLSSVLDHVFTHSTHHRGQLVLLVRDAGKVPQPLDLIAYLRST